MERRRQQPKLRSRVARETWEQTGGGPHGGSRRQRRRRDRQQTKLELKGGKYGN